MLPKQLTYYALQGIPQIRAGDLLPEIILRLLQIMGSFCKTEIFWSSLKKLFQNQKAGW